MNKFFYFMICWACLVGLSACHDDDFREETPGWSVTTEPDELLFDSHARYNHFTVASAGLGDGLRVSVPEGSWVDLTVDTVPQDGIVEFYAEANTGTERRQALLTVSSLSDPSRSVVLALVQRGMGEDDENGEDGDPLSDFRVGWGFNVYDEYKNPRSLCKKIIDVNKLSALDSDTTFQSVQEVLRGKETFEYQCAYSLQEMSSKMSSEMVEETNILGMKKTIHRYSSVSKKSTSEQSYGYARMAKTVASRSMDAGVLAYLVADREVVAQEKLPFTSGFYFLYNAILEASGDERDKWIDKMLADYGTHVVVEASVGCMIDYVVCFDKHETHNLEVSTSEQCKYVFSRLKKSEVTQNVEEQVTSDIANSNSFAIEGGSPATKKALEEAVLHMQSGDQVSASLMQDWMASVTASALDSPDERKNLGVVDFSFIPIWELFADTEVRNSILYHVTAMGNQSNCDFTEAELGTDNYHIDLTLQGLADFGTDGDATLVKVLYGNGVPLVEVCNEFVPKLRGDKRVTVFYPIRNGRTDIGQGFFPGDGEGNPPAFLTFSDGEVYVNPLEGASYHQVVDKVYYLHGNLYTENYGIQTREVGNPQVEGQYFQLNGSTVRYPIVKIGSGYWTRQNMREEMGFGVKRNGRFQVRERMMNGMLYANIFESNKPLFLSNNKDKYGTKQDAAYHERVLWYLPVAKDRAAFTTYLGNNLKAAFKGQISGFDADFVGYYGHYDVNTGGSLGTDQIRDHGAYCYIAFKEDMDSNQGEALMLTKDYQWKKANVKAGNNNYYPVRLFRTNYYQYPNQ